jgi:hypothetical protein
MPTLNEIGCILIMMVGQALIDYWHSNKDKGE